LSELSDYVRRFRFLCYDLCHWQFQLRSDLAA